ncbi:MAG TPA: UvrD-helicase domain-containing protein [Dehalococcoidia bacterium]|nr:UvrD-helicase domain-containing protein [Dehalococcoidia bacterium]
MATPTETSILDALNPRQREAVEQTDGPLLILAGPGSGKTRVIAHRIAYLVREKDVRPRRILAVTFTNKAAREMRDRVFTLVGEDLGRDITLGTFHAVCSRILRIDGETIGVPRTFTIYDDSDQIAAVKRALEDQGVDPKRIAPRAVLSAISRAKSELQGPREFAAIVADYFQEVTSRVFLRYQDLLEQNGALDFDDILLKTVELFNEREDVLEKYADRYLYVHIDEFQDTNVAQYVLAKQWASRHRNICVVGDPDQSIYSWRSADIRNILNFEHDFTDARIVILDQNYRSTQTILDSAHSVIALNKQRKEKNLWTDNGAGGPIVIHEAYDQEDEAAFVVEEIKHLTGPVGAQRPSNADRVMQSSTSGIPDDASSSENAAPTPTDAVPHTAIPLRHQDVAVMYRTNAQSRPVEEALVRRGIPYRLVGGTRFYERREVKDLLAYLRLVQNPFDAVAMMRIINRPARGIGDKTLSELNRIARERTVPPYAVLQMIADTERDSPEYALGRDAPEARLETSDPAETPISARPAPSPVRAEPVEAAERPHAAFPRANHPFQTRTVGALLRFLGLLNELIALSKTGSLSDLLDAVIDRTDYKPHIMSEPDGEERWENVQQLRTVTVQYDELKPEHALASFLEDVALITDVDEYDEKADSVTLITLHAAKGLEFPAVFIIGMEEGVLPHMRSLESGSREQIEEERRLCYVGMTRAKRHLYLVRAFRRAFSGHNPPSRFLSDIPPTLAAQSQRATQREMMPARYRYATAASAVGARIDAPLRDDEPPKPLETFSAGEHVRHPKFGEGIVVSCEPSGPGDYLCVIAFQGEAGIKKLLLSFAPLERVG